MLSIISRKLWRLILTTFMRSCLKQRFSIPGLSIILTSDLNLVLLIWIMMYRYPFTIYLLEFFVGLLSSEEFILDRNFWCSYVILRNQDKSYFISTIYFQVCWYLQRQLTCFQSNVPWYFWNKIYTHSYQVYEGYIPKCAKTLTSKYSYTSNTFYWYGFFC